MFGIGFGEMLMIAVVLLIAVGPKKMPTLMKAMGKGLREFRRATRELKNAAGIDELLRDDALRDPLKAAKLKKHKPRPVYERTAEDLLKERPKAGTDISHASDHPEAARAFRPPPPPKPDVIPTADGPVVAPVEEAIAPAEAEAEEKAAPAGDSEPGTVAQEEPVAVGASSGTEGSTK